MATRIKDIQQSQAGIAESADTLISETDNIRLAQSESVSAVPKYKIYKLVNNKRKGKVHIDGEADVVNPKTGLNERMRLLRGVSTIWMSEQKHIDKDYAMRNRRSLVFEGRVLRIPLHDTAAIEFAANCPHLIDNPSRRSGSKHEFFEWNPARQEEAAMAKRERKVEAMTLAISTPVEKMKKHALYLGVQFADELGEMKSEKGIRSAYVLKAEDNPEKFMESMNSQVVEVSYMVRKAVVDGKIDLGRERNSAYWSQGGGFIAKIPQARKHTEYLIELAMTNSDEGKKFLEQLQTTIK